MPPARRFFLARETRIGSIPAERVMADPAITLDRVGIGFQLKGGGRYDAVSPSDLIVSEGEFVALVGPTGCGKSTLLNAAAGLLQPSTAWSRSSAAGSPV